MSGKAPERLGWLYSKFWSPPKPPPESLPMPGRSDDISHETLLAMQKEMLQKVTMNGVDLDSLYGQTLQKIREQKGELPRLGMKVLMWVSHSKRQLRMNELLYALAVGPEEKDFYSKIIPSKDTVLGSCLGLVMAEKGTSRVRLIDDTLQQYLSRPGILFGSHKLLGETCIAYLNFPSVKALRADEIGDLGQYPFLEYASRYWGTHAKFGLSDQAKTLAPELLENFENQIFFTLFVKRSIGYYSSDTCHPFTGLHLASFLGIDSLVATLIKVKSCDINQRDAREYTPLMWAVERRNHGAAGLLLTCDGVEPDKPVYDKTPLMRAINHGDDEMVRVLMHGGADPTKPDRYGETPLIVASFPWNKRMLGLLKLPPITISDLD